MLCKSFLSGEKINKIHQRFLILTLGRGIAYMNCIKSTVLFLLSSVLLLIFTASGFAAEIRRVPDYDFVEQGFMALTLDVEGAENFRYTGEENKMHVYRGKIKPASKLKFVIRATLGGAKTLPITGRSCTVLMQIIARKGSEVIKTENFKKDNKINLSLDYTIPQGADNLVINETFVLNNKSKNKEYNRRVTDRSKLILSNSDAGATVAVGKAADSGDKKTESKDKNAASDKKSGGESSKAETTDDTKESKSISTGMLAGAGVAVVAIGAGAFFFMKKRKDGKAVAEKIARKEKLRQQEILHQQAQREEEWQRMMQEQARRQQMQLEAEQQWAIQEQNEAPQFCSNCGAKLEPDGRFCANCGTKV